VKKNSVVKCIAVPAVLTLSLGGALLAVVPANAAPADLTVTTNSLSSSRVLTVAGKATPNDSIELLDPTGGFAVPRSTVPASGDYSFTYTIPANVTLPATYKVTQVITANLGFDGSVDVPVAAPVSNALTLGTPVAGSTTASRTVTFSGTAPDGSVVKVLDSTNTVIGSSDGSITGTSYSFPVTFAADAPVAQTVTVTSVAGGRGADNTVVRSFDLPAAAPVSSNTLTLTSPAEGSTTASRTVTFTGTAPATSIVTILDGSGKEIGRSNGSIDGTTFSIPVTYSATASVAQKVTVSSFAGGRGADNQVIRDFNLPAAATAPTQTIATPKITSPANGAKITGKQVTFTGTGTPGANIVVAVVPTAEVKSLQAQAAKSMSSAMRVAPRAATPTDPANPIVVNAKGVWTVTVALKAGDYTADAASVLLDSNGDPVLGTDGNPVVAGPSNVVEFVLADAVTTAATGTTTPTTGSLAFTGSNAAPEAGLAAALLALGGGLMAAARRRRRFMK
jgi:hypothetical protein